MRVGDLYDEKRFTERLRANVAEKNLMLQAVYHAEPLAFEAIRDEFLGYAKRLKPYVTDTFHLLRDALDAGQYVFIEGAQGILLDVDFGTYPFVTSSNSSALGISAGTGIAPKRVGEVLGVAKAYTTRVGEGPFPTELPPAEADGPAQEGRGVRRDDGAAAPLRLVRRGYRQVRDPGERHHRLLPHQAGRAVRPGPGARLRGLRGRREALRRPAR